MHSFRASAVLVVFSALLWLGTAGHAAALLPADHRDLTRAECDRLDLPEDFCAAAAASAYTTDDREWDDLSAHAQTPVGVSLCDAATASAEREQRLAEAINGGLARIAGGDRRDRATAIARLLGRALHTVHDECAHRGMSNPAHAWLSRADFCRHTDAGPDVQPEALACARLATREVFARFVARLDALAIAPERLDTLSCDPAPGPHRGTPEATPCTESFLPGPFKACGFLDEAHDWDGVDRRWDHAVVGPALVDAFERGLFDETRASVRVCEDDAIALVAPAARAEVDVSDGPALCGRIRFLCLGSADDGAPLFGGSAASPLADDPTTASHAFTIPARDAPACSAGGSRSRSPFVLGAFVALVSLSMLRRRRVPQR